MVYSTSNVITESEEATLEKMKEEQKQQQDTLEANVDKTLAKLRTSGTEPIPEPEPEPNPEPSPEPEPEPDPQSEPEPEPDPQSEPKPAGDEPEPKPAGDEPVLTQADIRAAMRMEWSEDDIKELAQTNPDLAKKTCANALKGHNSLSKKLAESGKAQTAKPTEPTPVVTATSTAPEPKQIDFTALETQYENDPIIDVLKQVVTQSQAQAIELAALKADGGTKVDAAQAIADGAVSQQIDTFFGGSEIAAYESVYGKAEKNWDNLTQGQIKKRYEVVEQADMIQKGAQQQGMDMPLDEAFERAHLLVTEDVREQTIRKQIKAKTEKRSKSLTLAPTDSVKVSDNGKKTMAKVYTNAERLLAKLRKGR